MDRQRAYSPGAIAVIGLALAMVLMARPGGAQETVPVGALVGQTHVHGVAFDPGDPTFVFVATHHGLYRVSPDGMAERVSPIQDFMGFSPQPGGATVLFASGHPAGGGNLGFIVSTDGGRTWQQRSLGVGGPVDFHQMAASPADPNVVFGVYGAIQKSNDAGMTWSITGQAPPGMVDLAASAVDADTIYAATENGLYVSRNAGANWRPLIRGTTVSLVDVAPDGSIYTFALGQGLLRAADDESEFVPIGSTWVDPYLFHLAVDPTDPLHFLAATASGRILRSVDGGINWTNF